MTQSTTGQLKQEFNQKKAAYLSKEEELKKLKAEKSKAENMKFALEAELKDILDKTKQALEFNQILTADEYAELKTADFNVKAKIEYYQAVIEDLEEKIYNFKHQWHKELAELINIREKIFNLLIKEKFNEFKQELSPKLNEIYSLIYYGKRSYFNPNLWRDRTEFTNNEFVKYLEMLVDFNTKQPEGYELVNLIPDFEPKNPMKLHREAAEKANGTAELKGFEKLIKNLSSN